MASKPATPATPDNLLEMQLSSGLELRLLKLWGWDPATMFSGIG
jgi:hypothetical protein